MQRQCLAARLSILALAVSIAACGSFSASSKSVSNLISSPIKSSSNSSSPEDAYQADVADYTAAYIKSGGDASKLKYEISSIAEKHGVTHWELNESTYQGLGKGLKKAGLSQVEVDAYKRNLADTDEKAAWIQQGYDSASKD